MCLGLRSWGWQQEHSAQPWAADGYTATTEMLLNLITSKHYEDTDRPSLLLFLCSPLSELLLCPKPRGGQNVSQQQRLPHERVGKHPHPHLSAPPPTSEITLEACMTWGLEDQAGPEMIMKSRFFFLFKTFSKPSSSSSCSFNSVSINPLNTKLKLKLCIATSDCAFLWFKPPKGQKPILPVCARFFLLSLL